MTRSLCVLITVLTLGASLVVFGQQPPSEAQQLQQYILELKSTIADQVLVMNELNRHVQQLQKENADLKAKLAATTSK